MDTTKIRTVFVIASALATCFAVAAGAMNCSIVSSFVSPAAGDANPTGLDYYNGRLYHVASALTTRLYETTTTGSVISSFPIPSAVRGAEVGSDGVWLCQTYPQYYVYHYATTGSIIESFGISFRGKGITRQGSWLWFTAYDGYFYKTTTAGSVLSSYFINNYAMGDVDFDGTRLWFPHNLSTAAAIYLYTTTGSMLDYVRPVPEAESPSGCCWDGTYVWFTDYWSPNYCYKSLCWSVGIAPASFGRIKAMYR